MLCTYVLLHFCFEINPCKVISFSSLFSKSSSKRHFFEIVPRSSQSEHSEVWFYKSVCITRNIFLTFCNVGMDRQKSIME